MRKTDADSVVEVALPAVYTHEMGKSPKRKGMGFRCWAVKIWPSSPTLGMPLHATTNYPMGQDSLGNAVLDSSQELMSSQVCPQDTMSP